MERFSMVVGVVEAVEAVVLVVEAVWGEVVARTGVKKTARLKLTM